MAGPRVLLVGDGDLARETLEALEDRGAEVRWLEEPEGHDLGEALEDLRPEIVTVVSRGDAMPLRVALSVREQDPEVPLLVTVFDETIARQLQDTVTDCRVTSLADAVAPALAGPLVDPELAAVVPRDGELVALRFNGEGFDESPLEPERSDRARAVLRSVVKPYDRSARLLFYGLIGLAVILLFETIGGLWSSTSPWPTRSTARRSHWPPSARTTRSARGLRGSSSPSSPRPCLRSSAPPASPAG